MKWYIIRFYDLSKDDMHTILISKRYKSDASALRAVAKTLENRSVESIMLVNQWRKRYIVVRYRGVKTDNVQY